jgi:hypothetical protein
LALASVIGLIVAEPLVLAIFNGPITTQVTVDRAAAVSDLRARLQECNPDSGTGPDAIPAGCAGYVLPLAESPDVAAKHRGGGGPATR